MAVILIGGGSRSGKSRYALTLARERGLRLGFLATAQIFDDEMRDRVRAHRIERGEGFVTIEEPLDLPGAIEREGPAYDAIVVDCLTLWLSNLMLSGCNDIEQRTARLLAAAANSPADILLVTNEVGCGIVPENALARRFRDLAGHMNQRAAAAAAHVYWMAFGYPMRVK
ncbi:MAG: bifunctional adenosylcobinamide kinase/adenosylcobinamide-phosphate guanylyltransferase [Bryobacteraceae bacterium]